MHTDHEHSELMHTWTPITSKVSSSALMQNAVTLPYSLILYHMVNHESYMTAPHGCRCHGDSIT